MTTSATHIKPLGRVSSETWVRDRRLNHVDGDLMVGKLRPTDIHTRLDAARDVHDLNPSCCWSDVSFGSKADMTL